MIANRSRALTLAAGAALLSGLCLAGPASALTMKECSTKYQAAKGAGDTTKWNDFRKAQCGSDAAAAPAATPAATTTAAAPAPAPAAPAPAPGASTARATTPATGTMSYPTAVDPKYAKETAGKARMHTCLDAYKAAKANGTLGATKWIQKGGGYYSSCNASLKG